MALVNKIVSVSGVQFYNTSSVHCIVCSPPQVKSPPITIHPLSTLFPLPHPPPFPLVIPMLLSVSMRVVLLLFLFSIYSLVGMVMQIQTIVNYVHRLGTKCKTVWLVALALVT